MPQRFLKPAITNSSKWNRVSFQSQSLYIRLLTKVDDYGRCDGRTSVVLGECFSVWNELHPQESINLQQCEAMLQQLAASPIILIYEVDGKKIIQFLDWTERIRDNTVSKWPSPQVAANSCELLLPTSPPTPSPPSLGGLVEEAFKIFWRAYPRKEAKGAALKSFIRLGCYKMMEKILPAIERQRKTIQWSKDDGKFIPHPTTWLNQGRWEDEGIQLNGHIQTRSPDVWSVGNGRYTLESGPKIEHFGGNQQSFETHSTAWQQWRSKRLEAAR